MREFRRVTNVRTALLLAAAAFLACAGALAPARAGEPQLAVREVSLDKTVLAPGDKVKVSFFLTREAEAVLEIFSPHYEQVRKIESGRLLPAGTNGLEWDGKDTWGTQAPDEAYYIALTAKSADGGQVIYNPAADTGGAGLDIPVRLESQGGGYLARFTVPEAARVDIRAGIHQGPLLANIMPWKALPPGAHARAWDGLDTTGKFKVMEQPACHVYAQAYTLPDNTLLVAGGKDDYPEYHKALATRTPGSDDSTVSFDAVRQAAIVRVGQALSMPYVSGAALDPPVRFTVYDEADRNTGLADKGAATVSGLLRLVIEVAPEDVAAFNNQRYEIVVFIDNERVDEEEHAQTPYTYVLDTARMPNGEHVVTINQAGLNGQVGSYSFRLNVQNG
jgi:hypothetical protein